MLLIGATDTEADPDHHALVRLNGNRIGEARWNGLATVQATFAFDASLLADGENAVEIAAADDTAAPYSVFYLDSFALRYRSRYRATGDRLAFAAAGNPAIRVTGFTTPDVMLFDVTRPKRPVLVTARPFADGEGTWGVAIAPRSPGARYQALTVQAAASPARVAADRPSTLRSRLNRGRYIVVTTRELLGPARRLARAARRRRRRHRGRLRRVQSRRPQPVRAPALPLPRPALLARAAALRRARRRRHVRLPRQPRPGGQPDPADDGRDGAGALPFGQLVRGRRGRPGSRDGHRPAPGVERRRAGPARRQDHPAGDRPRPRLDLAPARAGRRSGPGRRFPGRERPHRRARPARRRRPVDPPGRGRPAAARAALLAGAPGRGRASSATSGTPASRPSRRRGCSGSRTSRPSGTTRRRPC